jgi:hypothetical protein
MPSRRASAELIDKLEDVAAPLAERHGASLLLATRVPGDDRVGVANAFGDCGTFMNCTYRMTTPYQ